MFSGLLNVEHHIVNIISKIKIMSQSTGIFPSHFSKSRAFRTLHTSKWHMSLEILLENKAFYFSKKVLRAGCRTQ